MCSWWTTAFPPAPSCTSMRALGTLFGLSPEARFLGASSNFLSPSGQLRRAFSLLGSGRAVDGAQNRAKRYAKGLQCGWREERSAISLASFLRS